MRDGWSIEEDKLLDIISIATSNSSLKGTMSRWWEIQELRKLVGASVIPEPLGISHPRGS